MSQRKRKQVAFRWGKTMGGPTRPMLGGVKKLDLKFIWTYNWSDLAETPQPRASAGPRFTVA
jgi:hypothetical protein